MKWCNIQSTTRWLYEGYLMNYMLQHRYLLAIIKDPSWNAWLNLPSLSLRAVHEMIVPLFVKVASTVMVLLCSCDEKWNPLSSNLAFSVPLHGHLLSICQNTNSPWAMQLKDILSCRATIWCSGPDKITAAGSIIILYHLKMSTVSITLTSVVLLTVNIGIV